MNLTFCGATEGVTGSNFLVETDNGTKFIVDCGLFQGDEQSENKNWQDFSYDPKQVAFVLVTHSHIDHIGRLPKLCRDGFRGFIHSTEPAAGFANIFLQDTRKIMQDEAQDKGLPELFSDQDVKNATSRFKTHKYHEIFEPASGIKVSFFDAGHILGSAFILVEADGKKIVFSGDLGNPPVPILQNTEALPPADYLVCESTYGDRLHEKSDLRLQKLERIIEQSISKNGVILMPSFAMERTQEILYELNDLISNNRIRQIPIFIDSPLAIKATEIYRQYPEYFDKEAKEIIKEGRDFFDFPGLKMIKNKQESKDLDKNISAKIIIAGSGMSTGGRILFHERRFLPEPTTTLVIVGFQVRGTLGRALNEGEKKVKILGEEVEVQATVREISSYSAHADQAKLKFWVAQGKEYLQEIFLVHGEQTAKETLKNKIEAETGLKTTIPEPNQRYQL